MPEFGGILNLMTSASLSIRKRVTGEEPIRTEAMLIKEFASVRISTKTEPVVGAVFLSIVTRPGHCAPSDTHPGEPKYCELPAIIDMLLRPLLRVTGVGSKYATTLDDDNGRI
jgi:hypothetical protein